MINWKTLVKNLMARGIGLTQCALLIGVPAMWLQPIWLGKEPEPYFSVGLKLLDLHLDRCPELHHSIIETA